MNHNVHKEPRGTVGQKHTFADSITHILHRSIFTALRSALLSGEPLRTLILGKFWSIFHSSENNKSTSHIITSSKNYYLMTYLFKLFILEVKILLASMAHKPKVKPN